MHRIEKTGKLNHLKTAAKSVSPGSKITIHPMGSRSRIMKLMHTEVSIGRDQGNGSSKSISINDPYINGVHCQLILRDDGYWIMDLDSENGVYLNDIRVQCARVSQGSKLKVGMSSIEFLQEDRENMAGGSSNTHSCGKFKTLNPELAKKLSILRDYSRTEMPILLTGESGSGKELLAGAVHDFSNRCSGAFSSLNCAAITGNLLESELFGHVRGAFTGAERERKGAFISSHGGTLFLDEIGELPLDLQAKLLRTLEAGEVKPLGSDSTQSVNVRLVTATNRDLFAMVQEGSFRLDLYFRICVLSLKIPALRERPEDIRLLSAEFAGARGCSLSSEAVDDLLRRNWLGNTRELKNTINKASIHCRGRVISKEHLYGLDPLESIVDESLSMKYTDEEGILKTAEKRLIYQTLDLCGGNRIVAAKKLGIAKSTLFQKLRDYKEKNCA